MNEWGGHPACGENIDNGQDARSTPDAGSTADARVGF